MARITEDEKHNFHALLDMALEKLDSPKNIQKKHWKFLDITELQKMLDIEAKELDLAVYKNNRSDILSECDDIINFALFIKYNLLIKQEITIEESIDIKNRL